MTEFNTSSINQMQATVNIGMIGSVSNGKSSLTLKLTGIKTQKHSEELKRNITVKLGYANSKIYKCRVCESPQAYQPHSSNIFAAECKYCGMPMDLQVHVSFVDCPGHHQLMATMMTGACVMDYSILVESALNNAQFPSEQTIEHLKATNIIGIENKIVCLNKIDVVDSNIAVTKISELAKNFKNNIQIVPISANLDINIDIICEYICRFALLNNKTELYNNPMKMIIIRSFNVNKPDTQLNDIQGGVIGGSITRGSIKVGDKIKILPGKIFPVEDEISLIKWKYRPYISIVESINSEKNNLQFAVSGGLIGVKLSIDPALTANDALTGSVIYNNDTENNYKVYEKIRIKIKYLKTDSKIEKDDILTINHNAANICSIVTKILSVDKCELTLESPICWEKNDSLTICQVVDNNMDIIGVAKVIRGIESICV